MPAHPPFKEVAKSLESPDRVNYYHSMEVRIAKLEMAVEHLQSDMRELKLDVRELRNDTKTDFRILFGFQITLVLGLLGIAAKVFGAL